MSHLHWHQGPEVGASAKCRAVRQRPTTCFSAGLACRVVRTVEQHTLPQISLKQFCRGKPTEGFRYRVKRLGPPGVDTDADHRQGYARFRRGPVLEMARNALRPVDTGAHCSLVM